MKKPILNICFFLLLIGGCSKPHIEKGTPSCVKKKISDFSENACQTGSSVKEYVFQSATVYVLDPGSCGADMTSEVTNAGCARLGFLGGIVGNTIINNEKFENAVFQRTVWQN